MISVRVNEIFQYLSHEEELLKKCHQCMEIIVSAKDRQAAEANKYASILLEEIDMERNREEKKKQSMAKKREKRRKKKKEKREREQNAADPTGKNSSPEPDGQDDDDGKDEEDECLEDGLDDGLDQIDDISLVVGAAAVPGPVTTVAMIIPTPLVLPVVSISRAAAVTHTTSVTATATATALDTATTTTTPAAMHANRRTAMERQDGHAAPRNKGKRNRKDKAQSGKDRGADRRLLANNNNNSKAAGGSAGSDDSGGGEGSKKPEIPTLSTTGIGDLDDFMEMIPSNTATKATPAKEKEKRNNDKNLSRVSSLDTFGVPLLSPGKPGVSGKTVNTPSPKKGQRREEGWKEVIRKSKKITVPANAINRVIGRSSSNLNAIREVSGAHIEVDRPRGHHDRNITIKGSADATRQAHSLIVALVKDPDRDLEQIIPKLRTKVMTTNTDSITSNMWHNSMANNIGTTATTTMCSASITTATTLKVQPAKSTSVLGRSVSAPAEIAVTTATTTKAKQSSASVSSAGVQGPAMGSFPTMGVWGVPPATTASSASTGKSKQKQSSAGSTGQSQSSHGHKSPKIVARQLFPSELDASSPLSTTTKTTVTYSSPSMAKTKVVPSSSPSTAVKVDSSGTASGGRKQAQLVTVPMPQQARVQAPPPSMTPQPQVVQLPKPEPQPLPIKTTSVQGMQMAPPQPTVPAATAPGEYSPFNNLFSQVAERVLAKKDDSEGRMNFASVAAAGVLPPPAAMPKPTAPAPVPLQNKVDPSLQAKAPGYKAPGQRTSSPHLNDPDLARAPGFQRQGFPPGGLGVGGEMDPMSRVPGFQRGSSLQGYPTQSQQPFSEDFSAGFPSAFAAQLMQAPGAAMQARVPGFAPFNMPQVGAPGRNLEHSPPHHRDEYSTPNQPMTLPRIDSNLNPNAPDFMSRTLGLPHPLQQLQQLQSPVAVGAASHFGSSIAQAPGAPGSSPGVFNQQAAFRPPPAVGQQGLGAAGPAAAPGGASGLQPPPHSLSELNALGFLSNGAGMNLGVQVGMPRQYGSMASAPRSSSASSLGASSRDGTSPVPGVSGEVSPMSSSAPSPTEQLRGLNMPRPIGMERVGKKGVLPGMDLASATLWASAAEPGSDWSSKVSSVVPTTTMLPPGGHPEGDEPRPASLPAPSGPHLLTGTYPLDTALDPNLEQALQGQAAMLVPGSSAVFANGVPAGAAPLPQIPPLYQSAGVGEALPSMWNPSLKLVHNPQEQPAHPDTRLWTNSWSPPPTM